VGQLMVTLVQIDTPLAAFEQPVAVTRFSAKAGQTPPQNPTIKKTRQIALMTKTPFNSAFADNSASILRH